MKLFTLGPVEMFPYTLECSAEQVPYFRTAEFSEVVLECEALLKQFAHARDEDKVVFLTSSGTGAMEATVMNCLTTQDHVLVIDGGSFGHRFVQLCELHQIPHEVIHLEHGEALSAEHLEAYRDTDLTALLVNIDETSTCQLYPIDMLSAFCKSKGMLLIVDAISSFLIDPLDFTASGVDALILSSQKAFALAPGLSMVLLSERMYEERVSKIKSPSMYFDFMDHLVNGKRGQTPFTPAVGVILQLNQRLRAIREIGLETLLDHAAELARDFRARVTELPVELADYPLSNACTPIIFKDGNAVEVFETLKNEYGLFVTPTGGPLHDTVLRVGHMGNLTIEDNTLLIDTLRKVLCG